MTAGRQNRTTATIFAACLQCTSFFLSFHAYLSSAPPERINDRQQPTTNHYHHLHSSFASFAQASRLHLRSTDDDPHIHHRIYTPTKIPKSPLPDSGSWQSNRLYIHITKTRIRIRLQFIHHRSQGKIICSYATPHSHMSLHIRYNTPSARLRHASARNKITPFPAQNEGTATSRLSSITNAATLRATDQIQFIPPGRSPDICCALQRRCITDVLHHSTQIELK